MSKDNDKDVPTGGQLHDFEQATGAIINLAELTVLYYNALLEGGIREAVAVLFTREYISAMMRGPQQGNKHHTGDTN